MAIQILEADNGAPRTAVCDECDHVWRRPEWDPRAATLPIWGRYHQDQHQMTTSSYATTVHAAGEIER